MLHSFMVRGNLVALEELEGILAVKLAEGTERTAIDAAGEPIEVASSDRYQTELEAFQAAGWVFVAASPEWERARVTRRLPPGVTLIGRVVRSASGRLKVVTDRLSVRLDPGLSEQAARDVLKAAGLQIVQRLGFAPNLFDVIVPPGSDALVVTAELSRDPRVVYAEPQLIEHIPPRYTPSDPDYDQQWQWENDGSGGGTADADVDAEQAWDATQGAGVRIAVIDNGIDVAHPDLATAIDTGAGYYQDDGMGGAIFVPTLGGFPTGNHGTFCAGLAAARADNGAGGCGMAPAAGLVPIACLTDQIGTQVTLARAVAYAADPAQEPMATAGAGVDVIACSLGPNGADWELSAVLDDALVFATTNGRGGLGTPIFWAVSNGEFEIALDEVCSHASVIAVGRSDRDDTENGSAFGPKLDFLAPGVAVYSTTGGGGYGTGTGTSYAAPIAAGVGTLVLAVNPDLSWQEVRNAIRRTCDKVGGVTYDSTGHHDRYGFGRVNAAQAVCSAGWSLTLDTPSVVFNDVVEGTTTARAIVLTVRGCETLQVQVIDGPHVLSGPGSFGVIASTVSVPATTSLTPRQARLWLTFTGTSPGDVTTGRVTIRSVQTGQEWDVSIQASTIAAPTVASVLVLDRSASMSWDAGDGRTRVEVLRESAPVFIDLLPPANAVGLAAFDHDAYLVRPVTTLGLEGPFDPARADLKGAIAAHTPNPQGNTAIGDGVELAHTMLDATFGFDVESIVVLTDGQETAEKYISAVAPLINERVFAIGLGTAEQINPVALTALTNGTGGYLLMTGTLDADDYFRLSKYYLQIQAGVTNADIVLDPTGVLGYGDEHRIPFRLTEADLRADVILLSPAHEAIDFALETPDGQLIRPSTTPVGTSFVPGSTVSYYRMSLPAVLDGHAAREGLWHARLRFAPAPVPLTRATVRAAAQAGLPYSLSVHTLSNLRMQVTLGQNSHEPGATMTLRVVLTEYDLPVERRARVSAELERPDKTRTTLTLVEVEPGVFETAVTAVLSGIYTFRAMATGATLRGRSFTREQTRTGLVWKGGDRPPPVGCEPPSETGGRPDDGKRPGALCKLLACMLDPRIVLRPIGAMLWAAGAELGTLWRCVAEYRADGRKGSTCAPQCRK